MPRQPKAPQPKNPLLHPRNPHQGRYDFGALVKTCPELKPFLRANPAGDNTINFSDPKAVMCLNKALLAHFYQVKNWQIPEAYLCPPIPGRADYIHNLADLLAGDYQHKIPTGRTIKVLDIGTGANCIYPIIGSQSYGWQFTGTDIDPVSIKTARAIAQSNTHLKNHIHLRQQHDPKAIFSGIISPEDRFDITMCNPPFHASLAEALASNQRKTNNLSRNKRKAKPAPSRTRSPTKDSLNFGGQMAELYCEGGEIAFLRRMVKESAQFAEQVCWFSSLVSRSENVRPLKILLGKLGTGEVQVMEMRQGQKISRIVAWSFLDAPDRRLWAETYWK